MEPIIPTPGQPTPMGTTNTEWGTNFVIFSRHATRVWLLLFNDADDDGPSHEFELDPVLNRTGDMWHIHLSNIWHGHLYLYRMDGPYEPTRGHRYNLHKPLLDPYAKAMVNASEWDFNLSKGYDLHSHEGDLSFSHFTDYKNIPKCVVYDKDGFDWEGDRLVKRPLNETIIYETHVRSLTTHPSANVRHPGTFSGIVEKIPYFLELGVTAIELLPIHQFNEFEVTRHNPHNGERLRNYWGYNTVGFFAPHQNYSHWPGRGAAVLEFKEMVKQLHRAGIEVILDVVFNHTAEGDESGPTFGFRGIDNRIYYILEDGGRRYRNFSGTGNTINANHPIVQDFIVDCLRYWVNEMHVDGFRFDLATALCRNERGLIPKEPPLVIRIAEDPLLRAIKIIAEPWDIGGYQVGHFPGGRWCEWNDKYRDRVRQFWRGDPNLTTELATRLAGSSDIYSHTRSPSHSINFVAAHDGFTLNDVVSYNTKHNEANGENNVDGHNNNISFNHGVEGPTDDEHIERLRSRQVKNFMATLLLSQGTPMINGGDEFRRTQKGNNNTYCHHNEISWYDWGLIEKYNDVFQFVKKLIATRLNHPIFKRRTFFTGIDHSGNQVSDIRWYAPFGGLADWHSHPRQLMCVLSGAKEDTGLPDDDVDIILMFNAGFHTHEFHIPPSPHHDHRWYMALDTGMAPPDDSFYPGEEIEIETPATYPLEARSMAMLVSKPGGQSKSFLRCDPHKHRIEKG